MGRQKKPDKIRKIKRQLGINQLTDYVVGVLCSGKENKNAQVNNQENIEVSCSSADPPDVPMELSISCEIPDDMEWSSISCDPPDDMEVSSISSDPPDDMEVSSIPTDPHELAKRIKRRGEERIKRRAVRPPPDHEHDCLRFGKIYQIKFTNKGKKDHKDLRERYPGLKKVLASLNTSRDSTYEQNPMSVTPLDQMCNETVNTENLRFGMASSAASPGHRPLEPAEPPVPAPGPTRPEASAHIHVRTVQEINSLPEDDFIHLLTGAVSRMRIAAMEVVQGS